VLRSPYRSVSGPLDKKRKRERARERGKEMEKEGATGCSTQRPLLFRLSPCSWIEKERGGRERGRGKQLD